MGAAGSSDDVCAEIGVVGAAGVVGSVLGDEVEEDVADVSMIVGPRQEEGANVRRTQMVQATQHNTTQHNTTHTHTHVVAPT
jgi:predicted amino acid dehydrogenase